MLRECKMREEQLSMQEKERKDKKSEIKLKEKTKMGGFKFVPMIAEASSPG